MKSRHVLLIIIFIYTALFGVVSFFKYYQFGYNGSDLAIFNQVIWNLTSSVGAENFLSPQSSAQGHSYFGDHFAPILYLIAPFYVLWKDPRWLLIIQSVILSLTAVPVFLMTKLFLNRQNSSYAKASADKQESRIKNQERKKPNSKFYSLHSKDKYAFVFSAIWLLNPFLHNINLFEFHLLPFALLFLLFAVYFYLQIICHPRAMTRRSRNLKNEKIINSRFHLRQGFGGHSRSGMTKKKQFALFILFIFLALLVREDVALIVGMLGIVMLIDHARSRGVTCYARTGAVVLVAGVAYFLIAQKIIGYFSPSGSYQFLTYYSWLAESSLSEMLRHVFSFSNINLIVAVLLPFIFLPLRKPKWLLLSLPPFLAAALSASAGSVIWQTHLIALWLPGLAVASITAYVWIIKHLEDRDLNPVIIPILLLIATVGSRIFLGPKITSYQLPVTDYKNIIHSIPQEASVASTYRYQTPLSSRSELYDFRYIWLGTQQYSESPYIYSEPDYIVIDPDDILSYYIQFPNLAWTREGHTQGAERVRLLLIDGQYGLVENSDRLAVMKKNTPKTHDKAVEVLNSIIEDAHTISSRCTGGVELLPDRSVGVVIDSCIK